MSMGGSRQLRAPSRTPVRKSNEFLLAFRCCAGQAPACIRRPLPFGPAGRPHLPTPTRIRSAREVTLLPSVTNPPARVPSAASTPPATGLALSFPPRAAGACWKSPVDCPTQVREPATAPRAYSSAVRTSAGYGEVKAAFSPRRSRRPDRAP